MPFIQKIIKSLKFFILLVFCLLIFSLLSRIGLAIFNQDYSAFNIKNFLGVILIGAIYDLSVTIYWLIPLAIFYYLLPQKLITIRKIILGVLVLAIISAWVFISASEFVFWHEFSSRFNFIAVDYLIYTNEVLGNIRQSYNLNPIFIAIALVSLTIFYFAWRNIKPYVALNINNFNFSHKIFSIALFAVLGVVNYFTISDNLKEFSPNTQINQLASNGQFEFGHAFFNNQINYEQFYATLPQVNLYNNSNSTNPLEHNVNIKNLNPIFKTKPNIVLISVESLGAEFLGAFGNQQKITPNLDKITQEGLFFSNLYATGTRTVRGLEAISLSIPPTPGNSIIKRPNNANLFSLGYILSKNGYTSSYIYGGYSYFDNMLNFFSNNSYKVIDRNSIDKKDIHYENIWGVADEDLFTLSLNTLDTNYKNNSKKPFFAHIMTTSNHRPFTYPENRIDIPSKTSREGAVKYTDWAIGDFIKRSKAKPWFENTLFIIVADHTSSGRGKVDLPIDKFHIPLIMYSPKYIAAKNIPTLASQIDIAPTLLALIGINNYKSKFFGQDIFTQDLNNQRAFMANYQTVGMYKNDQIVQLKPQSVWQLMRAKDNFIIKQGVLPTKPTNQDLEQLPDLVKEAITYYQVASVGFTKGHMKNN